MDFLMHPHHGYTRELSPLKEFTPSDYVPEPYVAPGTIYTRHNRPRFGFSNNFQALIDGGDEEQKQYIIGIIIGAMIVLIVAIAWFLAIVVLGVLGREKVGFFAGRLVRPDRSSEGTGGIEEKGGVEAAMMAGGPSSDEGDDENRMNRAVPVDATVDDIREKKFTRAVRFARGMFVLSGIIVIVSGGAFYGNGVVSFKNSVDEVRHGIDLVQIAALKTIRITENVIDAESNIEEEMEPTEELAAQNNGQICGLDSELSSQIRKVYGELESNVDRLKSMVDGSLQSFSRDLTNLVTLTEQMESGLDTADVFFYVLVAIGIVLIGIILAMFAGVFFAWKRISNRFTKCIRYAIVWPLFVFFLVLSWIFATLFLTFSLAGADFCIAPDEHVKALLDKHADMFEGIIFGFVIFYVSGCTVQPSGGEEIVAIANQAKIVLFHAHDLVKLIGELPIETIQAICGLTAAQGSALKNFVTFFHDVTHVLNRAIVGLREILQCETFNPIYTTFVHNALCVQGVSGLAYIFSTTLVISIFSMVMIMFRAAIYPIKEPVTQPDLGGEDVVEVIHHDENSPGEKNANDEKPVIY